MEIPGNPQKPLKYCCETCAYNTRNKKDYNKHLSTVKHIVSLGGNKLENKETTKIPNHICMCNKVFKTNSGLWKHKQTCNIMNTSDITCLTNLVFEVVKSNNELQKQNHEMQKQLLDVCKNGIINNLFVIKGAEFSRKKLICITKDPLVIYFKGWVSACFPVFQA